MWPAIAALAGLSLLKARQDQKEAKEQRGIESTKTRFSPWSGLGGGQNVRRADTMGTLMQGIMTGAMLGQSLGGMEAADAGQAGQAAPAASAPVSVAPMGQATSMRPPMNPYRPYG